LSPLDCEIAIVGGGPAGAATALFVAALAPSLRERVVVLDKASFPREKICAGAIGARADKLLGEIGVRVRVPAAEVTGLHVRAACGELTFEHGGPIGRVVRRIEYDAALLDAARERGIAVRDGVAVEGLRRRAAGVELATSAGALSARAVVGADGVGSLVRRALGLPRGAFHAQAVEVDTLPAPGDPPPHLLSFDVTDGAIAGYAWDFPTLVGGERRVCRGVYLLTRGLPERERADATAVLTARLAARGQTPLCAPKRFAERGLAWSSPLAVERVLLVGEAAGIDPVLGEGIPQAIFYARAAAEYLASRRGDYRFGDWRQSALRARVGIDLRIRAAAAPLLYGRTRPAFERWFTGSPSLARAGAAYFAGERVPRASLARAAFDLVRQMGARQVGSALVG
jgi:menaquinone-9 beta-reductase